MHKKGGYSLTRFGCSKTFPCIGDVPALLDGSKRSTIRAVRKDGYVPAVGAPFYAYTGMRSLNCQKILEGLIDSVVRIRIDFGPDQSVEIGGLVLAGDEAKDKFARADGFQSFEELVDWFHDMYGGDEFNGHLIEWEV